MDGRFPVRGTKTLGRRIRVVWTAFLVSFLTLVLRAQSSDGAEPASDTRQTQILLDRLPDRELRRTLLDRLSQGKIDLNGLKDVLRTKSTHTQAKPWLGVQGSNDEILLGATFDPAAGATTFRVFSPRALSVTLWTYADAATKAARSTPMKLGKDGIWEARLPSVGVGTYYDFTVDGPSGPGEWFDRDRHLSDPYAKANVGHNGRSLVIDTRFDWGSTDKFRPPAVSDLVVYEMHVKDFTAHPTSGVTDPKAKGKYRGLALGVGTTKLLGHLKQLGVNAVELLPIHEYDNRAAPPGHVNHWGYMTTHFFSPETSYASGGERGEAVREFQTAVRAFHEQGISVLLDVVYTHTAEGDHQGPALNFKGFDNPYFYRLTPDKLYYMNGAGCGNELKSENPMVRKMIIDSLRYFMQEYRVDGFRLDLGASLDKETLFAIERALPPWAILIVEPWTADWNRRFWDKGDLRGRRWALWNDGCRETLRAFVNGRARREDVMTSVAGSCLWFAARPSQSLNYFESHDGPVLVDLVYGNIAKCRLAAVTLLTSQGIPMLHEGQELLRTKKGNDNSYDQDNEINWIDWSLKQKNQGFFDFYQGLLTLRREYGSLRHANCVSEREITWLSPSNTRALGFLLAATPGDKGGLLVLLNSDPDNWVDFTLPRGGNWVKLCDGVKVSPDGSLGTASGSYGVPPSTGVILRTP